MLKGFFGQYLFSGTKSLERPKRIFEPGREEKERHGSPEKISWDCRSRTI